MMNVRSFLYLYVLLGTLLCLAGCLGTSPSPSLYILEAERPSVELPATSGHSLSLGIRQVTLPAVIERPQIVLIEDERVTPLELHRWSVPLDSGIKQVLTENLRGLINTASILSYPWSPQFKPDYSLSIFVSRFDGLPGGDVALTGLYLLERTDASQPLRTENFHIVVKVPGDDYAALVRGHSSAVSRLARQIAAALVKE
jgi:uncharacterized lipoprotein YmbA